MSDPDKIYDQQRADMVENQLRARGIRDERILNAMLKVPRHLFVPPSYRDHAYSDGPLPIGDQQTISQPFIVALMLQALDLKGRETVLEIGTGSGYQTALLAELCAMVYTLERSARLGDQASKRLGELGYKNVECHIGDGSQGLPDMSPFDVILVSAAAPLLPGPLCSQLNPKGGRLIIPVGDRDKQRLQLVKRTDDEWRVRNLSQVRFVPLVGLYGFDESEADWSLET